METAIIERPVMADEGMDESNIVMLDVGLIDPNPANPRRDVGDVSELADSIRAQGIRQNLLVTPTL
ncbi:ParB N-terminal domain-containing protein, partial [Thomasclavelia ramosa]